MDDAPNPYAVTTLHIDKPIVDREADSRWARWLVIIAIPLLITGSAAAVIDIESIVASGPIMLVYGAILVYLTYRLGGRRFRWFAWTCCTFPIAVFLIIFTLEWSPADAQVPISVLCCVFTLMVIAGILTTFAIARPPVSVTDAGADTPTEPATP